MCDHVPMDTANLDRVARRYRDAEAALDAARAELQTEAVDFLRQNDERGAVTTVVRITGWSREHLRRLRERAELEALRQQVAELGAAKKPRPAASPRTQVTQTVPEHVETVPDSVISPPVAAMSGERVKELAEAAEARHPEWIEQIRQAHSTADELRLHYLIVEAGVRMGFRPRELDAQPSPEKEPTA